MLKKLSEEIGSLFIDFVKKEEAWIILLFVAGAITIPLIAVDSFPPLFWSFIAHTWWFWIFFPLFLLFRELMLYVRQTMFENKINWVTLELRVPREIEKSPRAMEQVLLTFNSLRNAADNAYETYWDGQMVLWSSLEVASFGGEIHFYVRVSDKHKNAVEAAFFSYYPDVEIIEADDYMSNFPRDTVEMRERGLDIWGTEIILARESAYPIKTYTNFENPEEAIQVDPISTTLEMLSKIKRGEMVCFQIIIQPASKDWKDGEKKVLDKLQTPAITEVGKGEGKKSIPVLRTPGQTEVLEAVEKNISKPAFYTLIRVLYVAPLEIYSNGFAKGALANVFNQYGTLHLNAFKQNSLAATAIKKRMSLSHTIFSKIRTEYRENQFLYNIRKRKILPETTMGRILTSYFFHYNFSSKRFIMNVEGIATIFHPPTSFVLTAPHMKRTESKKAGPSAGLSIFGEEEEIEKFK
ncbi:MAG: hypothetical protein Q7R98_00625 [Candidatus Jorgensenbacteria bacterium]|nr:hypothetical protein [Candidatus Jorgensenbacteria bacterium]